MLNRDRNSVWWWNLIDYWIIRKQILENIWITERAHLIFDIDVDFVDAQNVTKSLLFDYINRTSEYHIWVLNRIYRYHEMLI